VFHRITGKSEDNIDFQSSFIPKVEEILFVEWTLPFCAELHSELFEKAQVYAMKIDEDIDKIQMPPSL